MIKLGTLFPSTWVEVVVVVIERRWLICAFVVVVRSEAVAVVPVAVACGVVVSGGYV